jgi:UDP-N-acetylglucosamine 1-carboxyvinyltransferase
MIGKVYCVDKYIIKGGKPLYGEVEISGAKNAAVAIIPAALLVDGVCRIENIPQISDTDMLLSILTHLGAKIKLVNKTTMDIDCTTVRQADAPFELMRKIRASYYLIGSMLGRFGYAKTTMPGGCNFGVRPIDQHVKGMKALGAEVEVKNGFVYAEVPNGRLQGTDIYLDKVSVGATMNIMIAAATAEGTTVIENAAKEPHIVDLANFLNSMGADVRGAGTDSIKIKGVEKLHGGTYSIIPDQIEAGTYMTAVAATGGEILIKNVIPKHLDCISAKLKEMGVTVENKGDAVLVRREKPLVRANVKTLPYPGFPTDMQPQISVVLCLAQGTSVVTEGVWDNRYRYVSELKKMGAQIQVDGKTAIIEGVDHLSGSVVTSCDLRAGAAVVIAGLCATGVTTVEDIQYIERGYQDIVGKLRSLGADIVMMSEPDPVETTVLETSIS